MRIAKPARPGFLSFFFIMFWLKYYDVFNVCSANAETLKGFLEARLISQRVVRKSSNYTFPVSYQKLHLQVHPIAS